MEQVAQLFFAPFQTSIRNAPAQEPKAFLPHLEQLGPNQDAEKFWF